MAQLTRVPTVPVFFSHWSPVSLSVSVPSPLSTKRRVVVVVGASPVVVVGAGPVVVLSGGASVVVVVSGGTSVVVVAPPDTHVPSSAHASQQLGSELTHAMPPGGALQSFSLCLILQCVLPSLSVRQQVTESGLPHVDCAAQCTTASLHSCRSDPSLTAACAMWSAQRTYLP